MSDPRDLKIDQLELEVAMLKTARDDALKRMIAEQNASLATGKHILDLEKSLQKYILIEENIVNIVSDNDTDEIDKLNLITDLFKEKSLQK